MSGDKYLTCPYVSSHKILNFRYTTHLVRCMKNFPKNHLKICDFDWSHHVPHDAYQDHLITSCPAKVQFETNLAKFDPEAMQYLPRNPRDDEPLDVDWDLDPSGGTYDPKISGKSSKIIGPVPPKEPKQEEDIRTQINTASGEPVKVVTWVHKSPIPEGLLPAGVPSVALLGEVEPGQADVQGGRFVGGQRFASNYSPMAACPPVAPSCTSGILKRPGAPSDDLNGAMSSMALGTRSPLPTNETGRGRGIYKDRQHPSSAAAIRPSTTIPVPVLGTRPPLPLNETGRGRGIYKDRQHPSSAAAAPPTTIPPSGFGTSDMPSALTTRPEAGVTRMGRGRGVFKD